MTNQVKDNFFGSVSLVGYLQAVKTVYQPRSNLTYLKVIVGKVKVLFYGKSISLVDSFSPGDVLFIEGELKSDRDGVVVYASRLKRLSDLFVDFTECEQPGTDQRFDPGLDLEVKVRAGTIEKRHLPDFVGGVPVRDWLACRGLDIDAIK